MRIRKRWPPPPPPPPPDLQSSSVSDHYNITLTAPPIQSLLPTSFKQNHNTSRATSYSMHLNQNPSIGCWEDNEKKLITSDQRTDQHQNVETSAGSSISSSFSNQVIEEWCEENKVIPIKKRRGSLKSEEMVMEREEIRKIVKKWGDDAVDSAAKKSSEGGDEKILVVEEGGSSSRCIRTNGRGWRCCQPSVVGYSLCEHHRTLNTHGRFRRKKVSSTWESKD
ncbi:uncharacterized protein LOC132293061 [Cornus florida]|uniref:uncharacterized protein LOC132293061 n=1 Tax=Cornus florida TaxID=4283 RepID=UPI00289FE475|nr:uncharacterized protein LOC132293061 [Cornus florida]